jgi:hypothetical protein
MIGAARPKGRRISSPGPRKERLWLLVIPQKQSASSTARSIRQPSSTAASSARAARRRATLDLSAATTKNSGDTNVLFRIPAGEPGRFGVIVTSSVDLGATATIAIGKAGHRQVQGRCTFRNVDTPLLFGIATTLDDAPLAAYEDVILTIAAAALPGAGHRRRRQLSLPVAEAAAAGGAAAAAGAGAAAASLKALRGGPDAVPPSQTRACNSRWPTLATAAHRLDQRRHAARQDLSRGVG